MPRCPAVPTRSPRSTQEKGGRRWPPGQVGDVADWDGRGSGSLHRWPLASCASGMFWAGVHDRWGRRLSERPSERPRQTAKAQEACDALSSVSSLCLHRLRSPLICRCFCPCMQILRKGDSGSFGQKVRYFPNILIS